MFSVGAAGAAAAISSRKRHAKGRARLMSVIKQRVAHTARMIQMMSAMIRRMPTMVQIRFLFMRITVRRLAPRGNA